MSSTPRCEIALPPPAPGWVVCLAGHDLDLQCWKQALEPPYEPWCERIKRGTEVIWALRSRSFDSMKAAVQVRDQALPLIGRLNGAFAMSAHAEPVRFDAVGQVDDQGKVQLHLFMDFTDTVRSGAVAGAEVRDSDGNLVLPDPPAPPQPSEAQRWMELAERNDDVADLLVFAGRTDNWFDIYKAVEVAERLVGGEHSLPKLLGEATGACKNMRTTANFHRHARGATYKPDVLTTLEEAKPLLSFIVRTVLDHKSRSTLG